MTLVQKAPKHIYYGEPIIVSDMQGPAPDGFHVPLITEWKAVHGIRVALGGGSSDGAIFGIALKLPFAGYRSSSSAGVDSQGSNGYYWSSSRYNTNYAYKLNIYSTALYSQSVSSRAEGSSVRCFKNSPTVPTSSWTKLYGTSIEAGGIFWSSADGLISLSSDGQTWVTIADKNLGATTVWNSGDTLSEANCGKYYQRGNNYGFPRTGSVTTSSTQVDASTYGPGNYYSSSTFITRSSSPYRWDTTDNGNLRGGESQGTSEKSKEIKAVYLGENLVRPTYKPRTFTISWTEQSDMSSGWTYSDDAAGLTAGDGAFDDFFGYSAVLLNTSGVETAEMTQSGGVFTGAMSTLGNITSGDNVMIKFPVRGIKMTKSGSTVTLSITDGLGRESEGYQYFAFSKGTINNITETKDQFYIGAYEGCISSSKLKSWSGQTPTTSYNYSNFQTYATNNGSGYDIAYFYQRMYIYALYIMKYGNPNAKVTIGCGNIYGNRISTGGANSQTNASYGATGNFTTACRLFGIENLWGNMNEWVGGLSTSSQYYMVVQLPGGAMTTTDIYSNANNETISSIAGTNIGMFYPLAATSSYAQYYWNPGMISSNYYYTTSGFNYGNINASGPIALFNRSVSSAVNTVGARLMYL